MGCKLKITEKWNLKLKQEDTPIFGWNRPDESAPFIVDTLITMFFAHWKIIKLPEKIFSPIMIFCVCLDFDNSRKNSLQS